MKNIVFAFLLISCTLLAQKKDKNWEKVIAFENEGKVKSANEIVAKIYKRAVFDKDEVQMIKCFFYQSKYLQVFDEKAQTKILNNLKADINRVSIPSKAILNLVYAKCLSDYYSKNLYTIYSRTNTVDLVDDFMTWPEKSFKDQIDNAYKKSFENEVVLKNTLLTKYEPIFDFTTENEFSNQTVYDYILKENINYYASKVNEYDVRKSDFNPYKKQLLGSSTDFIKLNFDFVKNENLRTVLSLYQKLETNFPTLENQWERMVFCKKIMVENDDSYISTLDNFQKTVKNEKLIQKIQLQKALYFTEFASKTRTPDYNIKAAAILDSILANNNRSNAYKLALDKKQYLNKKELNLQLQENNYEGENTRTSINYTNCNNLKISFYKINQKQIVELKAQPQNVTILAHQLLEKKQPVIFKNYTLLDKKDYFSHSTELLLPQLEKGSYLVYCESESDVKNRKAFCFDFITVTNISVLASKGIKNYVFQILDRKTGFPIENVSIKLPLQSLKTDKNGMAVYESMENNYYNDELMEFSVAGDTLSIGKRYLNQVYHYSNNASEEKIKAKVEFYLDRAIYRPGQTVFYKGIAFQKDKDKTTIVPNVTFKIKVQNPNYKDFKEFEVHTNEFGSFSGQFVLPKNELTGNFLLKVAIQDITNKNFIEKPQNETADFWNNVAFENSYIDFKVEEYKRPKFEALFSPPKKTFRVNQKVTIPGFVKAFAGSNISEANVKYEVRLKPFILERGHYYHKNGKTEVIATGETKTDATGKFEINFTAKPFENLSEKSLPIFNYQIKATITDINGETHDALTTIKVGYHDLILEAIAPYNIKTKNNNREEIKLTSTNLNGEFLAVKGELKIYLLYPATKKFKKRVFNEPEVASISPQDFEKLFPYEENEKIENIPETLVYSKKINSEKDKKIILDFITDYKSGTYKIVFTAKDSFNNLIEAKSNFQLYQSNDKFITSTLFTSEQINNDAKKDGFILVKIKSVIPELYISAFGNYNNKVYSEDYIHLQNHETIIKIPLKKEFENNLNVSFQSIFENENFTNSLEVKLEKEEKSLALDIETFRSKINPGSNENWSFKLKSINTIAEAEVLASMYDSSLDQFNKRDWSNLAFRNYNYNSGNYKTTLGFETTYTYMQNLNPLPNRIELNNESATKLMWFGFDFNDSFTLFQQREYQKQLLKKIKKPANAKLIYGIISDQSGASVAGVSIVIKGTQRTATSDFDGYYEIEAAPDEEIFFNYIGYQNQTVLAKTEKNINIYLAEDSDTLNEVVVTGYGTLKKKDLVGSVAEVIQEDNNVYNTAGIDEPLNNSLSKTNYKTIIIRGTGNTNGAKSLYVVDGEISSEESTNLLISEDIISVEVLKDKKATALYGSRGANGVIIITTKKALEALTQVKARKNLSETAFFLPNLKTDSKGNLSFNFTSPEALTSWKLRLLAHNKDAVSGYLEKSVITQKELMVSPNFPRFFREKDTIVISAKISNVTAGAKTGIASLQFFDAVTMQPIDAEMLNAKNIKNFTVAAFGNTTATWTISIPEGLQGVQYKILAKSGNFSDGEENIILVLTNNMLVTESIPIWVRENSTKEYTFENLKNNTSSTLKNHQFTLEYTSNPAWIAIQSLPYLMEYEHECAEQTFARFYANALASEIISSNPKIATVFEEWRKNGKLNSRLEENEELKSIILAETPWLNDAQSEEEKKKNLALLFDLEKMKTSQEATFDKLKQKQKSSGGFAWFDGSEENEYITRHILAGLGHLSKLSKNNTSQIDQIAKTAIPFLDHKFLIYHKARTKNLKTTAKLIWVNPYTDLHYLYARSFYLDKYPVSDTLKKATKMYLESAKKEWLSYSLYEKGLAALTLNRFGESETAKKIIESLKETSSNNEDWGMYWISNKAGWYWYQAPIETQALLIEAFAEVSQDTQSVDAMKVWLLKNKQTKNWPTTKSTTEAVYALLMQGNDWLSVKDNTIIKMGDEKILTKKLSENQKEAETGYIKLTWKADEIKKEMASISIQNKTKVPGFGGVYWQYFEDLDKIKTNSGAVLSVSKELYLKKNTMKGDQLEKITSKNALKTGDLVTVRLIISSKEDMEFVHLKDLRASCFEPVNVLSQYQYKDGLGHYMSTKDAATHLFFDRIDKGTYVIEYDIRVNNSGEFSNGITTIQSMYAPEFTSHTKGIRVKVQ